MTDPCSHGSRSVSGANEWCSAPVLFICSEVTCAEPARYRKSTRPVVDARTEPTARLTPPATYRTGLRATRTPRRRLRSDGESLLRFAERQNAA
jgi:hypothetical protein